MRDILLWRNAFVSLDSKINFGKKKKPSLFLFLKNFFKERQTNIFNIFFLQFVLFWGEGRMEGDWTI